MKVRNGYVSNSSSSSFVLNYNIKVCDLDDIKDLLKKRNSNITFDHYGGSENYVYKLDNKMKKYILDNFDLFKNAQDYVNLVIYIDADEYDWESDIYKVLDEGSVDDKIRVLSSMKKQEITQQMMKDDHSPATFEEFKNFWIAYL